MLDDDDLDLDEDEEEDDWAPPPYKDGKLRIMAEKCSTCIFRPGNKMDLEPGRVAGMLASVRANDSFVTCHKTIGLGLEAGAICRGSSDAHFGQLERVARRLDAVVEVTEEEIETEVEALSK